MAAIDDITALYVAYFNRAPDPAGLNFWLGRNQGIGGPAMSLVEIANSFAVQPEAVNLYSFLSAPLIGSSEAFLSAVYLNMFGRVANATTDAAGFAYWQAQLSAPGAQVGRVLQDIRFGATGNDRLVIDNKTVVGKAFVQQLVNTNTDFNLALAQSALTGVNETQASVDAKIIANNTAITGAGGAGGTSFNLTTGTDIFVGGSGDDVFTAVVNGTAAQTFTSVDSLDGGAGLNDVLNSLHEGAAGNIFPNGPINNIEVFNVRNLTGGTLTINAGNINGERVFNFDRGNSTTTVANLATGTTVGLVGDGLTSLGASNIGFVGTEATSILNISGGTGAATGLVTYTGSAASAAASPTALTINSTGSANTIGGLTLGAGTTSLTINAATGLTLAGALTATGLTSITASGAAANSAAGASAVSLGTAAVAASVTTIDASGLTAGGITAILGGGVSSFKGGAGNDTVTSAGLSGTASIDASAGTADRLNIAATTDVDTAAEAVQYKGFDVLSLGVAGTTVKVDDFTASTITSLRAGADSLVFNGVSSAQAGAVTVFGSAATNLTFVVNGSGVSGSDILNLAINDGAPAVSTITLGQITAANIETINFAATDNLTVGSMTGASGFTGSTITGTGNINITTGALALTSNSTFFNASAVGGLPGGTVVINAGAATAFGVSITGSTTYANTLTGTVLADTLVGGAGNDFLNNRTAGAATAADLLSGLGGQDTFQLFGDVASGTILTVYNAAARISDFGVTASSATTDILALSATAGNYSGASALNGTVAVAAAGATVVQSVAQNAAAAAITAGADLIKLTTAVAVTNGATTTQQAFNTAIGTGTVTGLTASSDIFASYYDSTNSRAVILLVDAGGGTNTVVETADVVTLIGTINMSAADYATFGSAQLQIVA